MQYSVPPDGFSIMKNLATWGGGWAYASMAADPDAERFRERRPKQQASRVRLPAWRALIEAMPHAARHCKPSRTAVRKSAR